jgi:phospholipase C
VAEVPEPYERDAYAHAGFLPGVATYGLRGFRVPCLLISPWSRGSHISTELFDHTSVLRLIEERWGLPVPDPARVADQILSDPRETVSDPIGWPSSSVRR